MSCSLNGSSVLGKASQSNGPSSRAELVPFPSTRACVREGSEDDVGGEALVGHVHILEAFLVLLLLSWLSGRFFQSARQRCTTTMERAS